MDSPPADGVLRYVEPTPRIRCGACHRILDVTRHEDGSVSASGHAEDCSNDGNGPADGDA